MAVVRDRQVHRLLDVLAPADVTDQRLDHPARLTDCLRRLVEHVGLVIEHDHARAFCRERLGHSSPDALRGAGDNDTFACEPRFGGAHEINPPWPGPRGMTGQMSTTRSLSTT